MTMTVEDYAGDFLRLVEAKPNVVAIFWARVLRHLTVEVARFRMRIILGVVLIRSLACT